MFQGFRVFGAFGQRLRVGLQGRIERSGSGYLSSEVLGIRDPQGFRV